LATADSRTARVWDTVTGRELLTLRGHTAPLASATFSPDGKRVATGCLEKVAIVWDAQTGRELLTLKWPIGITPGGPLPLSPDWKRVVGIGSGKMKVLDAETGRELVTLQSQTLPEGLAAYSADGKRVAAWLADGTVKVWDAETGRELSTLKGHKTRALSVTFSPDGKRVATAASVAKVSDAETGQDLLTLTGHTTGVVCVAFSPDGKRLATGGLDGTAKVWEACDWTKPFEEVEREHEAEKLARWRAANARP
jgi:WD40 repeat protein